MHSARRRLASINPEVRIETHGRRLKRERLVVTLRWLRNRHMRYK